MKAIGGAVLLIGLWFTWQQLADTRTQLEDTRKQFATQLDRALEDEVDGRFSRAIDYLNEGTTEARTGAVITLEEIALLRTTPLGTSGSGQPEMEHLEPTVRLLAGFVQSVSRVCSEQMVEKRRMPLRVSLPEVQTAMESLARLNSRREESASPPLDLRNAYLVKAELARGAQLPKGADLHRATLDGTRLESADLTGVNLRGASLRGADLTGANLADAILEGASLRGANLTRARLQGATLQNADLTGAKLAGVSGDLTGAQGISMDLPAGERVPAPTPPQPCPTPTR